MTKRSCAVGVCSSPEHCDEIAGCFSDPTAAVMRKALFFAKQILRSEGAGVTKQRHCFVTDVGDAIEKLADSLDPERSKPFGGDILDLLEWATKDVLELNQKLSEANRKIDLATSTAEKVIQLDYAGSVWMLDLPKIMQNLIEKLKEN